MSASGQSPIRVLLAFALCGRFHLLAAVLHFLQNDERMHHYQRGRTSIMGLVLKLRGIIETGRLVVVVMSRLVMSLV
jgi:hypothetical protein